MRRIRISSLCSAALAGMLLSAALLAAQTPAADVGAGRHDDTYQGRPVYKLGHGIVPPKMLRTAEAQYTKQARKKHIEGACVLSMIVDEQGLPQEIAVVRSLEPGLDENLGDHPKPSTCGHLKTGHSE